MSPVLALVFWVVSSALNLFIWAFVCFGFGFGGFGAGIAWFSSIALCVEVALSLAALQIGRRRWTRRLKIATASSLGLAVAIGVGGFVWAMLD